MLCGFEKAIIFHFDQMLKYYYKFIMEMVNQKSILISSLWNQFMCNLYLAALALSLFCISVH